MKFSLFAWIVLSLLVMPRAGAFSDAGEETQSLDGKWDFTTDSQMAGQDGGTWDSITVPGNWDTLPAYASYKGKGWYRRNFTVPPAWKGKHIRLTFGAVNQAAQVSLNGQDLGAHDGGYTPFDFDITGKINWTGDNVVVVCADNTFQRGAWWHWGGISRSVNLVANNDVRVVWQHITATPDLAAGTAAVTVDYALSNASDTPHEVRLASEIGHTSASAAETQVSLPPQSVTKARLTFALSRQDVRLWDFDHPNLYELGTKLSESGAVLHTKTDRFGIRKIEAKPDGLWLNGERVRLTGFNRVSDSDEDGNTEPDALVHGDIDLMKSCGAGMARLMHFPQAPNLLDYLDEKGMLIFEEIPVWGGNDPNVKRDNPRTQQWLTEMIDRDYNHPCVIGWSVGNEISGHYAYVKSMHEYIRQNLDQSRLLTYVSNTAASSSYGPTTDPAGLCDIVMINKYGGFGGALATVHQRWPDKPVFFSEWGFRQIGAAPTARLPGFDKGYAESVNGHPYLIGLSIWTFNDYRNGFTKEAKAKENREWGVVDIERHKKAAYDQVRRAYSPVHALTVTDSAIRIEPRSPDEVPSYALRGYQLHWETGDGTAGQSGAIPVPDLKPGDPAWETPFTGGPQAKVSLISPTGYDVTDWPGLPRN